VNNRVKIGTYFRFNVVTLKFSQNDSIPELGAQLMHKPFQQPFSKAHIISNKNAAQ
jgi:hypothetical protein